MCGIIGGFHTSVNRIILDRMLRTISHRGPDDHGLWVHGDAFLGNNRLSIQDLSSGGHQPMQTDDGRFTLAFNGEIYNHLELRKGLAQKGCSFRSGCDTETLLQAYAVHGPDCLSFLEGIFAFAVHDRQKNKIFIARDGMGVKPLYYYSQGGIFVFASELKALLHLPALDYSLDPSAFYDYLLLLYKTGTATPFRNIKKLLPGHYLEINAATGQEGGPQRYYQIPFDGKYDAAPGEQEWISQTEGRLVKAVTGQLLSDAPVGFFLSGGLDSSLVAAIARKHRPDLSLHGFTIDTGGQFRNEGFADDLPYAQKAAKHIGCRLEIVPGVIDIVREFDKMIWHLDEPQADPAALYVYHIAKAAKAGGIKVLLSGTGADDVFSGYRRHQALRWMPAIRRLPPLLQKGLLDSVHMLGGKVASRRLSKAFANSGDSDMDQRIGSFFWMQPDEVSGLFREDIARDFSSRDAFRYFEELADSIPGERNHLNMMLFWELRTFLPDHNLNYTDKMSMAAGVEVRVPYLDTGLVDFAAAMPPELKMKKGETKYILRQAAKAYLPKEIIYRRKTGFGAPVRKWIGAEMKKMVEERLLSGNLEHMNIFSPEAIRRLAADTHSGKRDGAYALFSLLAIESWLRQFTS